MRLRADREGYMYWEAGLPEEEELPEEEPRAIPDGGRPGGGRATHPTTDPPDAARAEVHLSG